MNNTQKSPWISVEDGLPDDELTVLITNSRWSDPVWMGYHYGNKWRTISGIALDTPHGTPNENHHPETEPPTHWMDLPEPAEVSES